MPALYLQMRKTTTRLRKTTSEEAKNKDHVSEWNKIELEVEAQELFWSVFYD